jgi:hypothetical protein
MLLLLRNYALPPALRLKPSFLPIATRHFLTTSHNLSEAEPVSKVKKTGVTKVKTKPPRSKSIKNVTSKKKLNVEH